MKKVVPRNAVLIPDEAKRKFEGILNDTYQWPQVMFDNSMATFEMLKRPDTVVVIAIVEDELVIIDEFQPHGTPKESFPKGRVDESDAAIISAAEREMREETGYSFQNYRIVRVQQPELKIEWFVYTLLAWGPSGKASPELDPGEKIVVRLESFEAVKELAVKDNGYLRNAKDLFMNLQDLDGLRSLPEFVGEEVDR